MSVNRYPKKRPFLFLQRGLQALVLSEDKKMRSSTTAVLKESEGLPCKLCKMVKILEPLSFLSTLKASLQTR